MELLIYAAFLVLAVLAYVSRQVASKGEERKVNVSNINFKRWEKWSSFSWQQSEVPCTHAMLQVNKNMSCRQFLILLTKNVDEFM